MEKNDQAKWFRWGGKKKKKERYQHQRKEGEKDFAPSTSEKKVTDRSFNPITFQEERGAASNLSTWKKKTKGLGDGFTERGEEDRRRARVANVRREEKARFALSIR